MIDVTLTIYSADGTREVPLTDNHLSIGRGGEKTSLTINDEGLSRLHATIHREGERVWILDEASTNGTYVNGQPVPPVGTPLKDADEITLGNATSIRLTIGPRASASASPSALKAATGQGNGSWQLPLIAAGVGLLVVVLAAVVIVSYASRSGAPDDDEDDGPRISRNRGRANDNKETGINSSTNTADGNNGASPSPAPTDFVLSDTETSQTASERAKNIVSSGKRYATMTPEERTRFVAEEAQHIARRIGNRDGNQFTPEALSRIKANVDAYFSRARLGPSEGCRFGQSLNTTLTRASQSAPFINRAFNQKGLSPVIGLYLAMIESEYCVCLTSPTGPKGMFQFTRATARTYGLQVIEPEERCIPEKAAPAAAAYMKALIGRYGTGPLSVPLSIASYNSGEGGLSGNLARALESVRNSENPERSFWTLVANADMMSDQFQKENIKYVPKFFAAAIVGENPRVFGVEMEPLSTYTQ
ncbi:MAG TPA: FHA domain-containing protein [Pyrinomonadaceae bacterium]|jgi:hypothetical protein